MDRSTHPRPSSGRARLRLAAVLSFLVAVLVPVRSEPDGQSLVVWLIHSLLALVSEPGSWDRQFAAWQAVLAQWSAMDCWLRTACKDVRAEATLTTLALSIFLMLWLARFFETSRSLGPSWLEQVLSGSWPLAIAGLALVAPATAVGLGLTHFLLERFCLGEPTRDRSEGLTPPLRGFPLRRR